jgi:hypothetical protein
VVEHPKHPPLQYATAHLSIPHFSVTIVLIYILELVTYFGDFGFYCGLLKVAKLLGDWGIVNVIVM